MQNISRFEVVLESIETLPEEDQAILLELVGRRLAERRRAEIARNIADSRTEYQTGQVHRGTADDLMAEIGD